MSIFSRLTHYDRPGPGVDKDGPKKPRIVVFFEILFRKFFNLCKLNLLFLIPVIAVAAIIYLAMNLLLMVGINNLFVALIPVVLIFPFIAGLTYVTRNYAREEHAFIFSDFKDSVKENWGKFLIHGIITYALFCLFYISITFYYANLSTNKFYYIPFCLCIFMALVTLFMQFYIPVMIVTFDLKLIQIYKNALIFSFVGAFKNLLLLLIFAVMFVLSYLLLAISYALIIVLVLLWVFLAFAFISFLVNFTVYPLIEKLMIIPYYAKQEESEEENVEASIGEGKNEAAVSTTTLESETEGKEGEEESKPQKVEYVYENGRLIRKYSDDIEPIFEDNRILGGGNSDKNK